MCECGPKKKLAEACLKRIKSLGVLETFCFQTAREGLNAKVLHLKIESLFKVKIGEMIQCLK
jgi:hypothetical protein